MDNLYLSALFAKACYKHDKKVLIAGVTRPALRGLPVAVVAKEPTEKRKQIAEKNKVKAAVLKGDSKYKYKYKTLPSSALPWNVQSVLWLY